MKKEELTKEQLRECQQVWIEVKELYLTGYWIGLCAPLRHRLGRLKTRPEFGDCLIKALNSHKPEEKNPGDFWFPWDDTESRLNVLNKLIQEFSPQ